jgi:S1-C subfamily serine protease
VLADEEAAKGAEVYTVGFPGEPDLLVTNGRITRVSDWNPVGVTYYETDTWGHHGQSGGVLTNGSGEVLGILGWLDPQGLAIAASMADESERIEQMTQRIDVSGIGPRHMPESEIESPHSFSLSGP